MPTATVYEIVTEQIIKQLEAGTAPWSKPWNSSLPKNLVSKKEYRGVNLLILATAGKSSPYWVTFNQAKALGGSVRKGEHGTKIVFWKTGTREAEDGEETKSFLVRYYTVFNVSQCDGIETPAVETTTIDPLAECEAIIAAMPNAPKFATDGRAYYRPSTDTVAMPERNSFHGAPEYYSTFFHELVHSTGHNKRLGRDGIERLNAFGSESYSKEELVAEVGAAMLCGVAGIVRETLPNSAAYLAAWIKVLKSDAKMIVSAASAAQKAADYIRNVPVAQ